MKHDDCSESLQARLRAGVGLDDSLVELRREGFSKIDSIYAVFKTGQSLDEAKRIVRFSAAGADLKESHEKFHDDHIRELLGDA